MYTSDESPVHKQFVGYSIFMQRRTVNWADTDAAAIVYTGRLVEFMLEAIEAWARDRLHVNWYHLTLDRRIGTPFVNVNVDFKSPVTPREDLEIAVLVENSGTTSVTYAILAYGASSGVLSFSGRATTVFVTTIDMKPLQIPEEFKVVYDREALEAAVWVANCAIKSA